MAGVRRPQDQMEIDEIDAMLGEDESVYAKARQGLSTSKMGSPVNTGVTVGERTNQPTSHTMDAQSPIGASGVFDSRENKLSDPSPGGSLIDAPDDNIGDDPFTGMTPAQQTTTPPKMGDGAGQPGGPDSAPVAGGAYARYGTGNIPGAENIQPGDQAMPGFNTAGWGSGERGTNSIKNTFGKIASRYPPKPSSLQLIVNDPDFKRFFPEATVDAKDKIDFGDGFPVDVLVSADPGSDTSTGWSFQTSNPADAAGGGAGDVLGGMGGAGGAGAVPGGTPDESALAEIMAALDAMAEGGNDPLIKQELDKLLRAASPELGAQLAPTLKGKTPGVSQPNPQGNFTGRTGGVR